MGRRDRAQQAAVISQDPEMWRQYRNLRNTATRGIRRDRNQWEKNKLDNLQNAPINPRRNIKGWLGWKNTGPPSQLFYKGETVSSPQGLADSMNSIFIGKVQGLRAS